MTSTGNVAVEKPATEKKTKVPKAKKPRTAKTASHPPYFQMIKEALLALKEKGGSSPHAIGKYMEEKHKAVLPENFKKMLALQLKNSVTKGKLAKVKASYKLITESTKKGKAPAAGKKKRTGAARATATVTGGGSKKAKGKRMTPAKAKQPKSIKSAGGKRARKGTA